jgi:hypothetical protein
MEHPQKPVGTPTEAKVGVRNLPHADICRWFAAFDTFINPYYPILCSGTTQDIYQKALSNTLQPTEGYLASLIMSMGASISDPHITSGSFHEHPLYSWSVVSTYKLLISRNENFMDIQSLFIAAMLNIQLIRSPRAYLHLANERFV